MDLSQTIEAKMADIDETKEEEKQEDEKKREEINRKTSGGVLSWIIMFVVVVSCGSAGFVLGRLFAASRILKPAQHSQANTPAQIEPLNADAPAEKSEKGWYYDLEPIIANLNEPGVTRYVRVKLTLEISPEVDKKKGIAFFNEKNPLLTNWLAIYFASLNLENIRGDNNLKRIQSQIRDSFNEQLFPDSKPKISRVLFKEFAVQ